jgi:hypothetical protein
VTATAETASAPPTRWSALLVAGLGGSLGIAFLSFMAALAASSGCAPDETFHLGDPGADQSAYCTATHFPGFPDTLDSLLLVGAIYAWPTLVALTGTAIATASKRGVFLRVSLIAAALMVPVGWALSPLANVSYTGI